MTKQQIYNKVKRHLLKQGKKSIDGRDQCMYRGPGGTMCAVGCLIPDNRYNPGIEGSEVYSPFEMGCFRGTGITRRHLNLLMDLQAVHDSSTVGQWPAHLAETAREHGLKP